MDYEVFKLPIKVVSEVHNHLWFGGQMVLYDRTQWVLLSSEDGTIHAWGSLDCRLWEFLEICLEFHNSHKLNWMCCTLWWPHIDGVWNRGQEAPILTIWPHSEPLALACHLLSELETTCEQPPNTSMSVSKWLGDTQRDILGCRLCCIHIHLLLCFFASGKVGGCTSVNSSTPWGVPGSGTSDWEYMVPTEAPAGWPGVCAGQAVWSLFGESSRFILLPQDVSETCVIIYMPYRN